MSKPADPVVALVELEAQEASLVEQIELVDAQTGEALKVHVRSKPSVVPWGDLNSEPAKLRRKRERLEKTLAGVRELLPHVRAAAVASQRELAERELDRLEADLREVEGEQPQVWERLRAAYGELVRLYVGEAGRIARTRREIDVEAREVCANYGDLRTQWESRFGSVQVRELPSTLASCLRALEQGLSEDDPQLAQAVRDRPEMWFRSTGVPIAGWGVGGVIERVDD